MGNTVTRLYEQFQPSNYDLSIDIKPNKQEFSGTVVVSGTKVGRPSQRITLHQKGLKINEAKIEAIGRDSTVSILVTRINTHASKNEVRIHTKQRLLRGKYKIHLTFQGKISESMLGIYPSVFDNNGVKETVIATQFESHHAREAFPCIDEPEAKATFDLTLITAKDETALANMPTKTTHSKSNRKTTTFNTTPIMSTYLLAFVTGNLHCVSKKSKSGVLVRTWSVVSRSKDKLEFALNEASDCVDFFNDYFGVPYPLPKCDSVALPDFDAGAMENWGLITYRETALLDDPKNPSISNQQFVSLVIAHEMSHQWFGNLVTMKWWDDLWLNESFASIMEYIALDNLHPDWKVWEQYVSSDVLVTSNRDIYSNIQPVGVTVTDPDLIHTLFDPGIVYAKGGRLLNMLREHIGDDAFRQGLTHYFKKHAYKNTTRKDLWSALAKSSSQDVTQLLTPWIEQPGMPKLTVVDDESKIQLNQERFLLDAKPDGTIWPIPLSFEDSTQNVIMDSAELELEAGKKLPIINPTANGHFITHYKSKKYHQRIVDLFNNQESSTPTRINILNDMLLLSRSGDASLVEALSITINNKNESRDAVWGLMSRSIGYASQLTEGNTDAEAMIKDMKRKLAKDWYSKLGWNDNKDDGPNTKQLRHTVTAYMLGGENQAVLDKAITTFNKTPSINDLPSEIRPSIIVAKVKHDYSKELCDSLIKQYTLSSPDVQADIAAGLSSVRNPSDAQYIIDKTLSTWSVVRSQDLMRWIVSFLRNYHVRGVAWKWVVDNWLKIEATLSQSKSLDYLPVYMASVVSTEKGKKDFLKLFADKRDSKTLKQNISIGLADIEARIAWRKRDEKKILTFLEDHLKND